MKYESTNNGSLLFPLDSISRRDFMKRVAFVGAAATFTLSTGLKVFETAEAAEKNIQPDSWHLSLCPYCGAGCGLYIGEKAGKVVAVKGADEHPANKGYLCMKGLLLPQILYFKDRLTTPLIKKDGKMKEASWDEAIDLLVSKFKKIIQDNGKDAVAFYESAQLLTEEHYVLNKLAKGCIGTNNVDANARLCMASAVGGMITSLGKDGPPANYSDIELADCFFITGANMAEAHPVLYQRIADYKSRKKSVIVIVVDPRKTITTDIADVHLKLHCGTDIALYNAIAHVLFKEKFVDEAKVASYTNGLEELKLHIEKYTPEYAANITGVKKEDIIKTAMMLGSARAALYFCCMGLNHSSVGVWKNNAIINLCLLTGHIGKPGAGYFSLTGQPNAMGLREAGGLSHLLPGHRLVENEVHRNEIAAIWGVDPKIIAPKPGKNVLDLFRAADKGDIKGLWIIGTNPAVSLTDVNWVIKVLQKIEFLVVQDIYYPTETSKFAHLVLPAAQWAEKLGTFTNSDRTVNLLKAAVKPPAGAKSDLDIFIEVAHKMGYGNYFQFKGPEDVYNEWKRCSKGTDVDVSGITYARLEKQVGIPWPCPSEDHQGTLRRYTHFKFYTPNGKANLLARDHKEPLEVPDSEYPLCLNTGRLFDHWMTLTRTGKIPQLINSSPESYVEIHPDDAQRLAIKSGVHVNVISRRGDVILKAKVTDTVTKGEIFIPFHYGYLYKEKQAANLLTNPAYDPGSKEPEYKACAVKIEKA
ncbi:MAG: nitrate reductase [Desulfobacterales bacterium]|nr:nitrate reductase [Desulfobacterales bacterium]